ncbi:DUF815 domain-containing protein [Helicobacter sp. T3_23-1056]
MDIFWGSTNFAKLLEVDFEAHKAFVLRRFDSFCYLHSIRDFDKVENLIGLEEQVEILRANTASFLSDKSALNVLAWGARGCGKSSCVKQVLGEFLEINSAIKTERTKNDKSLKSFYPKSLRVIELDSKDILLLPLLFDMLRDKPYKFIIFCDDLSFRAEQNEYKSIKSVLEGSLEARAKNILLYATSNIRKLIQNAGADNTPEHSIVQEELSLSDRFGLQIGFYDFGVRQYLECVETFLQKEGIKGIDFFNTNNLSDTSNNPNEENLNEISKIARQKALNFATKMGSKNARIAKDFALLVANGVENLRK